MKLLGEGFFYFLGKLRNYMPRAHSRQSVEAENLILVPPGSLSFFPLSQLPFLFHSYLQF